jgi:hypothetical protein
MRPLFLLALTPFLIAADCGVRRPIAEISLAPPEHEGRWQVSVHYTVEPVGDRSIPLSTTGPTPTGRSFRVGTDRESEDGPACDWSARCEADVVLTIEWHLPASQPTVEPQPMIDIGLFPSTEAPFYRKHPETITLSASAWSEVLP